MGFTIEDLMVTSRDKYQMDMIAGRTGWSNSISWVLMIEDRTIIKRFDGKELAVTTGLGFQGEQAWLDLASDLTHHHASGLVVNIGDYIAEIPESLIQYCDANDLPLITVPWDVHLADMIKDLSVRIFLQGSTDEQISNALIQAIEHPGEIAKARQVLLPYFDVDGSFQVVLIHPDGLDAMDTVERKRLGYRLQIYFANITHNSHFYYYDASFVMVINDVDDAETRELVQDFYERMRRRMPELACVIGVGSRLQDLSQIGHAYERAWAAVRMARDRGEGVVFYDDAGLDQILYSVSDDNILQTLSQKALAPLVDYDGQHNSAYVDTLEQYILCGGSIQAVSEAMYTHRNTVLYRMRNIKQLLGNDLESADARMLYLTACRIRRMRLGE